MADLLQRRRKIGGSEVVGTWAGASLAAQGCFKDPLERPVVQGYPISLDKQDASADGWAGSLYEILGLERTMSWHVRFFSPSLNHDMMSPELATEEAAFEAAWQLAESGEAITSIEGPEGTVASADEVELWFREQGRTQPAADPI